MKTRSLLVIVPFLFEIPSFFSKQKCRSHCFLAMRLLKNQYVPIGNRLVEVKLFILVFVGLLLKKKKKKKYNFFSFSWRWLVWFRKSHCQTNEQYGMVFKKKQKIFNKIMLLHWICNFSSLLHASFVFLMLSRQVSVSLENVVPKNGDTAALGNFIGHVHRKSESHN